MFYSKIESLIGVELDAITILPWHRSVVSNGVKFIHKITCLNENITIKISIVFLFSPFWLVISYCCFNFLVSDIEFQLWVQLKKH